MNGYEGLIVGCVIFIPVIAVLLMAAWKNWHGQWLSFVDLAHVAGEGSESLKIRKGRRAALVYLVGVASLVGVLGITAFSAFSGYAANLDLVSSILIAYTFVSCSWLVATSRRDAKAAANAAGSAQVGEYVLDVRRVAMLALAILAILAAEIACSFVV